MTTTVNADALKKKIADLKVQVQGFKDLKSHDPKVRSARKALKRAQRKLSLATPEGLEARVKRLQRNLDFVGKQLGELTKGSKKVVGNPFVHSLRKKTKSYNKRIKAANRRIEAKKASAPPAPAAPAAQA